MSRKSEIKYKELIEAKPYLTKKELSLLLSKKGKNLDKKISQLIRDKYLIPLKKGLYTTKIFYLINKTKIEEYLANVIYYPSYLSTEYVLSQEGLIPEAVYSYTSITNKKTKIIKNELGVFIYRKIKNSLFLGYRETSFLDGLTIKKASRAKALFDFFYFKTFKNLQEIEDLRINWDNLKKEDWQDFYQLVMLSKSAKMKKIYNFIAKNYAS